MPPGMRRCLGVFLPLALIFACHPPPGTIAPSDAAPPDGDNPEAHEPPSTDAAWPAPARQAVRLLAGEARLVGRTPSAAVSASGRFVAVALSASGQHQLHVVDLEGGPPRILAEDLRADPAETAWDGDVLVMATAQRSASAAAFKGDILLYRAGWTQAQRAVAAVGLACDVAPGEQAVACVQGQDPSAQTYNVSFGPVDGSTETRVILSRQYYDELRSYSFQWTPDGRHYVVSGRADAQSPELITVHAAGTGATVASLGPGSRPRLSPDSGSVVFLTELLATADGILVGNARVAPVAGLGPAGAPVVDRAVASAFFLDAQALLTVGNPQGSRFDLRRVDLDGGRPPATVASALDGLLAINREPRRLAVIAGSSIGVLDEAGRVICQTRFEAPVSGEVTRFTDGARSLVFADRAEIFLGAGTGRLMDLETCAVRPLTAMLRWALPAAGELLLGSTSNARIAHLHLADPVLGGARLLQERIRFPFGYSAAHAAVLFTLDEGPDAGLYRLPLSR